MHYSGLYRGYVADRKDPEKRGRLMLRIPAVYDDQVHEYWAEPMGMYSGQGIGMIAIPQEEELVWVQFEAGNARFPVWSYGHWVKDGGISDIYDSDGLPTKIALVTKSGQKIIVDDKEKTIEITHSSGQQFLINEDHMSLISSKSKGISLGTKDESKEPATLADTLVDALNDFMDDLGKIGAITTNTGVTSTLNTSPMWAALVAAYKQKFEKIKSKIVTLD